MIDRFPTFLTILIAGALLASCGGSAEPTDENGNPGESSGHAHTAPHGGALVALGEHFAHVEVCLDPQKGTLTAYLLDREAEKGVRSAQDSLTVQVRLDDGTAADVVLWPVANKLSGETAGDTSVFSGWDAALAGVSRFAGSLVKVTMLGGTFENVAFAFPEGNEHLHGGCDGHDHSSEHGDGEAHR